MPVPDLAAPCPHPADSCTWDFKGPGGTVAIIDGQIHATCDNCGARVFITPAPGWIKVSTEDIMRPIRGV